MRAANWTLNPDAIIDDAKYDRIVKACRDPRVRLAVRIAGNMGWRVGEIVHIKIEDIDLPNHRIRKWVLKKRGGEAALGKDVMKPISKFVEPDLAKVVGKRTSGWLLVRRPSLIAQLKNKRKGRRKGLPKCDVLSKKGICPGGHISKRWIQLGFDGACRTAKMPDVKGRGIHSLRHTFAFRAAERTKDPFKVRDMLDHADVSLAAVYVQSSNQREVQDLLDSEKK